MRNELTEYRLKTRKFVLDKTLSHCYNTPRARNTMMTQLGMKEVMPMSDKCTGIAVEVTK